MRFLLLLLLSPLIYCVAQAQETSSADEPKEFQFHFNVATNQKDGKRLTESEFGFSRLLPEKEAIVFDTAVAGTGGFLKKESVTFLDKNGLTLATLNSEFQNDGRLKSQTITAEGKPARLLTWYQKQPQSPFIEVPDSVIRVRYSQMNGFLRQRVVALVLPSQSCQIVSNYDDKGRRIKDTATQKSGENNVVYNYGPHGLMRFFVPATKQDVEREALISYLKGGELDSFLLKESGVVQNQLRMVYKDDGVGMGQRFESYRDGVLATSMTTDIAAKTGTQDDYDMDGKTLVNRRGFLMGKTNILIYEEKWTGGKLAQRTDYDLNGRVTAITNYKADGTVDTREAFNSSASTVK